jgi:nitrite reductase/ring-hydroxylating ferredoxin subunit
MLPEGCDDPPVVGDDGWSSLLLRFSDLTDGRPVRMELDGSAVLLVRNGDELFAIGNRCSHQGAPLHKGPVRFGGSLRTVQCPLHGSTFDLTSGKVLRGPATEPVPAYETRAIDGVVEIRAR